MALVDVELRVYIDLTGDGDFVDTYENVSAYVRYAEWFIGWRQRYQDVADMPTLTLTLDNSSREWSPEVAASFFSIYPPLQKQVYVTVRYYEPAIPGYTELALWRGWIDRVDVTPGRYTGDKSVTVYAVGHKAFIDQAEVRLPLQEAKRADQIIDAIFTATAQPIAKSLDTGAVIYPYAGDTFDEGMTGYDMITAVVQADRGRFWYDRTGTARFANRTNVALDTTVDVSGIAYSQMTYTYAADVINDVRVKVYPRALSVSTTETLWTRQGNLEIPPGSSRTLRATFNDGTGTKVAGRSLATPSTGAGTLAYTGGSVSISAFVADAQGVEITLTNAGPGDATVTTLIVKGQKLTALNVEEAMSSNATSISAYGKRSMTLDLPLLYSYDLGKDIADYELFRRATPRGTVAEITQVRPNNSIDQSVLLVSIMNRVTVTEYMTGHTGTYWVIGEEHRWSAGNRSWEVVYTLEPADTTAFWLLEVVGRSELDQTTILGL